MPLDEVPIVGADADVEERIRDILAGFERDTGGGRVALTEIRLREIPVNGRLDRARDRVTLNSAVVETRALEDVLVHELCHSLDYAEDIVDASEPWDTLAATMFDPTNGLVDPNASEGGRRSNRHEAFAAWCELGAFSAELLARPCGEATEIVEAAQILDAEVWTGPDRVGVVAAHPGPPWTVAFPGPLDELDVAPSDDPDVVFVGDRRRDEPVDLRTGDVVDGAPDRVPHGDAHVPDGLPDSLMTASAGWTDGPAATRARVPWHWPGLASKERLLWSDGERWSLVGDGCLGVEHPQVFEGADDVWLGWTEDAVVRLRPVAATEPL